MGRAFRAAGTWLTKVESWWSLGVLVMGTSALTWVAAQWNALASQGWAAVVLVGVLFAALLIIAISLVYLALSRRKATVAPAAEPATAGSTIERGPAPQEAWKEAAADLSAFVTDHLLPTCDAQMHLQDAILAEGIPNQELRFYAVQGAGANYRIARFTRAMDVLTIFRNSPTEIPPFDRLVDCIATLESSAYVLYCEQADALAEAVGVKMWETPGIREKWAVWRKKHNAMRAAYESIKRDQRFKTLYRPMKESRWGGIIPPEGGSVVGKPDGLAARSD